jgi:hypothetical protein
VSAPSSNVLMLRCSSCACSMCTVNHRTDIIPWYVKKGYVKVGEKPFPEPDRLTRASHMIYYEKMLPIAS